MDAHSERQQCLISQLFLPKLKLISASHCAEKPIGLNDDPLDSLPFDLVAAHALTSPNEQGGLERGTPRAGASRTGPNRMRPPSSPTR